MSGDDPLIEARRLLGQREREIAALKADIAHYVDIIRDLQTEEAATRDALAATQADRDRWIARNALLEKRLHGIERLIRAEICPGAVLATVKLD